jgi:hypothetical protein
MGGYLLSVWEDGFILEAVIRFASRRLLFVAFVLLDFSEFVHRENRLSYPTWLIFFFLLSILPHFLEIKLKKDQQNRRGLAV